MTDEEQLIDSALLMLQQIADDAWGRVAYDTDEVLNARAYLYSEIAAFADDARLRLRRLIDMEAS